MASIGVLSSIPCDQSFKDFLQDQINANVAAANTFTYKDDNTTIALLDKAILDFNAGHPVAVSWIITLGGRIAYDRMVAATSNNTNTLPFVSLLGAAPANPPNLCHGGVSLESYQHNADRVDYLVQQNGFGPDTISLFYNQYSPLQQDEINHWNNVIRATYPNLGNPVQAFQGAAPTANDYATTVPNIPTQHVTVSADPFFHKTKGRLVAAFNGTNKYVCYPLHNYENANPHPNANFATLLGSTLEFAIKVLGVVAALAINGHPINTFIKDPVGKAKDL
jgi:hypothetical protein